MCENALRLRLLLKQILLKHSFQPDKEEKAMQTVLEQAAVLSADWAWMTQ